MAFTLNERGNIDSLPLFTWEIAPLVEAGCLLRLVLARHADEPETDAESVQLTMSAEQMALLVQDLQKILEEIETARRSTSAH